jgi:hypothetical protein
MDAESLFDRVRSELSLSFPRSFRENYGDFVNLLASNDFNRRFGRANAVKSIDELRGLLRELEALGAPASIIPFMWQQETESRDYYCFDTVSSIGECPVIVFSAHAVVHCWPDFRAFLEWVRNFDSHVALPSGL